ncbi:MAG TPA: hypothetical protein VM889_06365 [Candidatus Thermoplasmatota archaeon]|nr:hypothetical protein [Candidatus Thermoplasmatota archaeon]
MSVFARKKPEQPAVESEEMSDFEPIHPEELQALAPAAPKAPKAKGGHQAPDVVISDVHRRVEKLRLEFSERLAGDLKAVEETMAENVLRMAERMKALEAEMAARDAEIQERDARLGKLSEENAAMKRRLENFEELRQKLAGL